jgi:predicted transcriptional regulator
MIPKHQIFRDENVINAINAIVFKADGIYDTVMRVYGKANALKQREFEKILQKRKHIRPEELDIKDQYCLNKRTVDWYVEKLSVESGLENICISAILEYEPYE